MSLPRGLLDAIPGVDYNTFTTRVLRRKISTGDELRQYQLRAAFKVFHGEPAKDPLGNPADVRDGTAVHVDMGLGKTVIALTAIVEWYYHRVIAKPVLIVAPIKVCESVWRQEARDWSHTQHLTFSLLRGDAKQRAFALNKPAHVYLINREGLKWLQKHLREDWSFFDAIIIDDTPFRDPRTHSFRVLSHYGTRVALKWPDGRAMRDHNGDTIPVPPHRFKRGAYLTGTPSPGGLLGLWGPMYLMDHGSRLHRRYDTYQSRFFHKTQQVADHIYKYEENEGELEERPEWQARDGAPERIHEIIADVVVELNAEDYGVLPKVLPPFLHYVDMPASLRPQYDTLERDAILELTRDTVLAQNGGAKSMMCWQFANGAVYAVNERGVREWHELHSAKLDKLVELIETINGNVIIPYYFKHDLERITARLHKEGIPFTAMGRGNSERVVEQWNAGGIENLLLHPNSAAHGLNLQFGGHNMLWFTMLWSLERYAQTNARIARSGQKYPVANHHILTRSTTDDLMYASLGEHGDDQSRFRAALRKYQQHRGLGIYNNGLAGLGI